MSRPSRMREWSAQARRGDEVRCDGTVLIRGARVIDPASGLDAIAPVLLQEGIVTAIGSAATRTQAQCSIEADGCWLIPGIVDLCARFREPGQTHKATFGSETRAAQASGVTHVLIPPDTQPAIDTPAMMLRLQRIAEQAGGGLGVHVLGALTRDLNGEALAELSALKAAGAVGASNGLAPVRDSRIARRALEYAKGLLRKSLSQADADRIIKQVTQQVQTTPFSFLQKAESENLLTFIQDEHPQTIALILAHLPAQKASEIMVGLPSQKQIEVVKRIANMEQTNPEVIKEVERGLEHRLSDIVSQTFEKAGGVDTVAEILNLADRSTEKGIMEGLEAEDPDLVEQIRRLMFVFEDILLVNDKGIQSVLKEVDNEALSLALKTASEDGVLTKEERRQAKDAALQAARSYLGTRGLAELGKVLGLPEDEVDRVIGGRVEASIRRSHLARHVVEDLGDDVGERQPAPGSQRPCGCGEHGGGPTRAPMVYEVASPRTAPPSRPR